MPRRPHHAPAIAAVALLIGYLLLGCPRAMAGGVIETEEFAEVVTVVEEAVAKYGAENVLLVCDIDNTLLAMNRDLGSDQWWEWQSYLLANEPDSPHLVAEDFPGLLTAQGLLFQLGRMHPPQKDLPKQVKAIQATGVRTLVLTSRGDEYREATERELKAAGYDFKTSMLATEGVPCGIYEPYDIESIESSGLTADEAERFKLSTPRGVSFSEGIFMTAGQHKGAMLLTMLARCPHEFKAVIFVDDHGRHVLRVYDALTRRGLDVTTIHYQREDANVARFRYSDKSEVDRQWRLLDKTLEAVFQ